MNRHPLDPAFRPPRVANLGGRRPVERARLALVDAVEDSQVPTVEGARLRYTEALDRARWLAAGRPPPPEDPDAWAAWALELAGHAAELTTARDQLLRAIAPAEFAELQRALAPALDADECPDTVPSVGGRTETGNLPPR